MRNYNRFVRSCTLTAVTVAGLVSVASARQFNIDFNSGGSATCPATYAAAGTAGVWNPVDAAGIFGGVNLVDKAGLATPVTMVLSPAFSATLFDPNPAYLGDDATLMRDIAWGGGPLETIDFANLPNGTYDIYTYAQAPDNKTGLITGVDCTESGDGNQLVSGAWSGAHALGVSYAKHTAVVTAGTLHLDITAVPQYKSVNGIQIELAGGQTGTPYCFGDGSGADCPCFAFGAVGEGCANTAGSGATLTGSGNPSVSLDSFQLDIAGVPGAKPGLILRGDDQVALPAGDGILCTVGNSQRSQVQVTVNGSTTFTDFNGAPFGSVANLGTATNFQFWYRDAGNACGGGFNFTNGWTVNYQP